MILSPCAHEKEIVRQLALGHWPQAVPTELLLHAATCRACGDLVLVTQSLRVARANTLAAARPAAPGTLWWRAQLRRRSLAVERIGKPILGAQLFAFSLYLLVAVGFLISQARHGFGWLLWLQQQHAEFHLHALLPRPFLNSGPGLAFLLSALAALGLLSLITVVLSVDRK